MARFVIVKGLLDGIASLAVCNPAAILSGGGFNLYFLDFHYCWFFFFFVNDVYVVDGGNISRWHIVGTFYFRLFVDSLD